MGADAEDRPCIFVFHGGSGSSEEDIATAVKVKITAGRQEILACEVILKD